MQEADIEAIKISMSGSDPIVLKNPPSDARWCLG
jgi:hypothetical protein